ncbi:MAG: FecR domain-containing protein [Candidatus Pseudobacter hemicellulosilyticus]|uniref:FecR domain-containing protein n=1 Tax=Candidatus Pseudobacter hemicellulosilyticus TaxID=3121375 RepID=A0AAJ5WPD7_9BACT|nr:MAG: FecR domain-containing protein [Pseudobacter sp.]
MKEKRFLELFARWTSQHLTPAETAELLQLYAAVDAEQLLTPALRQRWAEAQPDPLATEQDAHQMVDAILRQAPATSNLPITIPFYKRSWVRYAAAILVLLAAGASWFVLRQPNTNNNIVHQVSPKDIQPAHDGAVLTLADGTQVVLDSLGNGLVTAQNGVAITLENGRLSYKPADTVTTLAYNTLRIPKGRQLNLSLPDGTRLWLNANSTLVYPAAFVGKERLVEISGEAYFEVAHNPRQPFKVKIRNQAAVEVVGTHFNVNAYEDENTIQTTLLQGAVKVISEAAGTTASPLQNSVLLKPGQQARIAGNGQAASGISIQEQVNLDQVMAWKNGLFNFEDASLKEVMNQLERWYDIEVVYEKGIPAVQFGGEMSRNVPLSDVLEALKAWNIHFRMESGRKLVVLP